ncbi:STAS domain-containing protein [Kitasatospora sp. NPDC049258]|uniref:STAS domain-containing protein n=1 Tax=Kitasatospora sp. NPDC049258 TaxID=3155394 RepID=UPI00341819D3
MIDPEYSGEAPTPDDPAGGGLVGTVRRIDGGALVCSLTGELDLDGALAVGPVLDEALRSAAPLLVIDLSAVEFCDSSGLNLLLRTRIGAEAAGTAMRLAGAPTQVRRLLEITGTDQVFSLDPTLELALAAR